MGTVSVATDIELYYEVQGSGQAVVLIHGWPLSGRAWEKQIPALVDAGYQVITYDRRGFGNSSQVADDYSYDTLAADLNALLEHLDVNNAVLVGFSMGGGEVARYLSTYGDKRVSKAVLAAAVTPYLYKTDDNPEGGLDDAAIAEFIDGVNKDRLAFLEDFSQSFFSNGTNKALISEPARIYHRDIAAFASPKATVECIKAFSCTDFRDDLGSIDIPVLVIHGKADGIVPAEVSAHRTHKMLKHSNLVMIEAGPHGLNYTHAEAFNQALLEFLQP